MTGLSLTCLSLLIGYTEPVRQVRETKGKAILYVIGDELKAGVVQLRFSSTLKVVVWVSGGPALEVDSFNVEVKREEWALLRQRGPRFRSDQGGGGRTWEKELELDAVQPDKLTVPAISLRYRDGGGEWQTVRFTRLPVEVSAVAAIKGDGSDVRGELDIETLPGVQSRAPLFALLAALLVMAGLLSLLMVFLLRRPRTLTPVPAHERALRELTELQRVGPGGRQRPDWFHTRLSAIVRRYLEERFALRASRQTTEEFFAEVGRGDFLNAEQQRLLRALLASCDLAKFSGLLPSPDECSESAELARQFVHLTMPPAR